MTLKSPESGSSQPPETVSRQAKARDAARSCSCRRAKPKCFGSDSILARDMLFVPGRKYRRKLLHDLFGGQRRGGISTPAKHPVIFIFTGEAGHEFGYKDGWKDEFFYYTGVGRHGDMEMAGGNRAIMDHIRNRKELHLFKMLRGPLVEYVAQMLCVGVKEERAPDADGRERRIFRFILMPVREGLFPML